MAHYVTRRWQPTVTSGLKKADLISGEYQSFVPNQLRGTQISLSDEVLAFALAAQQAAVRADEAVGTEGVFLNHMLIRSESIASSRIEGYRISPKRLAVADITGLERESALEVIANVRATELAIEALATKEQLTVDDLVDLQHTIAPDLDRGIRTIQNWIGGSSYSPLFAAYVPPPPELVPELLADLVEYVNESAHPGILKAAIAHAQFETIHPFIDGNGRTGRALIHTILRRDDVLRHALIPISAVFSTGQNSYIEGLAAYRKDSAGRETWVRSFAAATALAAEATIHLHKRVEVLNEALLTRLFAWRKGQGLTPRPRPGSTVLRLLESLASTPVTTTKRVAHEFGVSSVAAENALNELAAAGIVARNKYKGSIACYSSDEHLNLVAFAERQVLVGGHDTAHYTPDIAPIAPESEFRWTADGTLIDTRL